MIRVTVLYPNGEDVRFDHVDYETRHRALVKERLTPLGLRRVEIQRGVTGPEGPPRPFTAGGSLYFDDLEAFQAAMEGHGEELMGDVPRFSDTELLIQVAELAT